MATRSFVGTMLDESYGDFIAAWSGLTKTTDDVGNALHLDPRIFGATDRSIQITGTTGVGGTIVIQGSNQVVPTNWDTLTDAAGDPLSFTAVGLRQILEATAWIRPAVTAGDGNTLFVATLYAAKR